MAQRRLEAKKTQKEEAPYPAISVVLPVKGLRAFAEKYWESQVWTFGGEVLAHGWKKHEAFDLPSPPLSIHAGDMRI